MEPKQNGHGGLTREQILAAMDLKIESVDVPEWGGTVYVRNMTGRARDQFESSRYKLIGEKIEILHQNTRAALLAASLCDSKGTLMFSEKDVEALGEKNGAVLDRLFDVAQRLSGLRQKDAEEKLKNSARVQSVNSGT